MSACAAFTDGYGLSRILAAEMPCRCLGSFENPCRCPSHPCDSGRNLKNRCAYKFIPNPSWISIGFMHTDFFVCLRRLHGWGTDFHVYFIEGIWGVFSCWGAVRVIDVGKLLWIDFGRWRGGNDGAEARGERQKEALTSRRASPCSTKPQWSSFR